MNAIFWEEVIWGSNNYPLKNILWLTNFVTLASEKNKTQVASWKTACDSFTIPNWKVSWREDLWLSKMEKQDLQPDWTNSLGFYWVFEIQCVSLVVKVTNHQFYTKNTSGNRGSKCALQRIQLFWSVWTEINIPSGKLSWQWKSSFPYRKYIYKWWIFHCYVSLPDTKYIHPCEALPVGYWKVDETERSRSNTLFNTCKFTHNVLEWLLPTACTYLGNKKDQFTQIYQHHISTKCWKDWFLPANYWWSTWKICHSIISSWVIPPFWYCRWTKSGAPSWYGKSVDLSTNQLNHQQYHFRKLRAKTWSFSSRWKRRKHRKKNYQFFFGGSPN